MIWGKVLARDRLNSDRLGGGQEPVSCWDTPVKRGNTDQDGWG